MKKTMLPVMLVLLASAAVHLPANAWRSAGAYGHAEGGMGGATRSNDFGGSTTHVDGVGTSHTNAYGGSTTHSWDGGTTHDNAYGGSTTGAAGYGAVHTTAGGYSSYRPPDVGMPAYAPYHPPVAIAAYTPGCVNCASIVHGGDVVGVAPMGDRAVVVGRYPMGVNFARLPSGAVAVERGGASYYQVGDTWFRPAYGANGVYYSVVSAP